MRTNFLFGWDARITSRTTFVARQAVGLGLIIDLVFDQRRQHITGVDRVDGDVGLGDFQGDRFCQPHDPVLGHDIGRLVGRGDQSMGRTQVDDPAPVAFLHAGQGRFDRVPVRHHVDGDNRLEPVVRKILDRRDMLDTGIVDQNIDASEGFFGVAHHRGDGVGFGHVGAVIQSTDAVGRLDFPPARFRFPRASPKPMIITFAPSAASARTMSKPIPLVEPVTMADLPVKKPI